MQRNVHNAPGNSPLDYYYSIPPITRGLVTGLTLVTVACQFNLLSPSLLALWWPFVFQFQVWRLITNFFYMGKFSFRVIIMLVWAIQYGKILEGVTFQHSTADYLFMLLFGGGAMLAISLAVPFFRSFFLAPSLVDMLLYVWSRNFPTQQVSIMGLVTIQSFYMPFAFMALDLLMGGDWKGSLLGILAGHLYYFLAVLHPAAGGQRLLQTPTWLKYWLLRWGIGNVPQREVPMANPAAPGFRAFQGPGRRLQ